MISDSVFDDIYKTDIYLYIPKKNFNTLRLVDKNFKEEFERYFIKQFEIEFDCNIKYDVIFLLSFFEYLNIDIYNFKNIIEFLNKKENNILNFWEIIILNSCLIDSSEFPIVDFLVNIYCFKYIKLFKPNRINYMKDCICWQKNNENSDYLRCRNIDLIHDIDKNYWYYWCSNCLFFEIVFNHYKYYNN
ncbi:10322_t:CDS:1 [Cetraspora pellucida]|uniref:10322_t:CDS:1 n=1 Tax=Cetraspora pellucida TaxID=1433469 RepID=A0A9N9K349_9GLOM|nr:10322_t:CDS:1 [Cetraspora pellucida]